jgi:hypothetical protein
MNYLVRVPIRLDAPGAEEQQAVLAIHGLPGFVRFEPLRGNDRGGFELAFEVEGATAEDAAAAGEELLLSYEDALERYSPRKLAPGAVDALETASPAG